MKVGIVGGSGHTGVELPGLLLPRTDVEVAFFATPNGTALHRPQRRPTAGPLAPPLLP